MFVILIAANFKFPNDFKGPIKRAGKVCGESQDLKSPGKVRENNCAVHVRQIIPGVAYVELLQTADSEIL